MAEGLKIPTLTQREFIGNDFKIAERMAQRLGYRQTAYTSTSQLWGLFCLPENPEHAPNLRARDYPPYVGGCIIHTRELGYLFVQDMGDLRME